VKSLFGAITLYQKVPVVYLCNKYILNGLLQDCVMLLLIGFSKPICCQNHEMYRKVMNKIFSIHCFTVLVTNIDFLITHYVDLNSKLAKATI
jgi:hypothetical protein